MDSDSLNRGLERLRKKVDDWLISGSTENSRARRELIGKLFKVLFIPFIVGTISVALFISKAGNQIGIKSAAPHKLLGSAGEFKDDVGEEFNFDTSEFDVPGTGGDDLADLQPTVVAAEPSVAPTATATVVPTEIPVVAPTAVPTLAPTTVPTLEPTAVPTAAPTKMPTAKPTSVPTVVATLVPTKVPTAVPTLKAKSAAQEITTKKVRFPAQFGIGSSEPVLSTDADYAAVTQLLNRCSGSINIVGHSDWLGAEAVNYEIALQRAAKVRDLLVKKGFESKKVKMVVSSLGSKDPVADNRTNQGRASNRRVEIICE